ncbi:hypothetical protein M0804_007879 [Polistes exclamans]|nr:hypothetical protein M0804_007879 [Polistes exclamans]
MKETNYNYNVYGKRSLAKFYLQWNVYHIKYDKHYTESKTPLPGSNHEEVTASEDPRGMCTLKMSTSEYNLKKIG